MARLLFGAIVFAATAAIAQNTNLSVAVGGASPPITHPNVIPYNVLTGPYKHVVILSIDGLHQVIPPSSNARHEINERSIWLHTSK